MSTLIRSNPHTHTQFCDGRSTAEEMVLSALDKGFHTLGFSSHSYYPPDISWCMAKESVPLYIAEVRRLQEKYASSLRIRLGLELDLYSLGHMDLAPYEYLIGSVHDYLSPVSGRLLSYDNKPAVMETMLREDFGNDPLKLAKHYYEDVYRLIHQVKPLIIGHFDLITKFNDTLHLYDTADPAYFKPALEVLLSCCEEGSIPEVNTGAMARGYRTSPYPAEAFLKELLAHGYPVILSSDAHDAALLDYALDETALRLKDLGFKSVMALGKDSLLEEVPLI